jgi:hypothetical protein
MFSYKQSVVGSLGRGEEVLILRSWQLSRKKCGVTGEGGRGADLAQLAAVT